MCVLRDHNQQRAHPPAAPAAARDSTLSASHGSQAVPAAAPPAPSHSTETPKPQEPTNGVHDVKEQEEGQPVVPAQLEANNATSQPKAIQKRPSLLGRNNSDKSGTTPPDSRSPSRRGSWVTSLTSKFSSSQQAANHTSATNGNNVQNGKPQANGSGGGAGGAGGGGLPLINPYSPGLGTPTPPTNGQQQHQHGEDMEPYVPQPPETSRVSFLSNALRRLSSGSQAPPPSKVTGNGGMCPRRVMNIDQNRERCLVPELDSSKLRRVAFCVDVEIAGAPRYRENGESPERKRQTTKDKKMKERGEGEALKNPDAVACQKEKDGVVQVSNEEVGNDEAPNPEGTVMEGEEKRGESSNKKKEKKKRSEAERKERKEKKRRKAEENGSVPMELTRDDDGGSSTPQSADTKPSKPQDRPTTDPLRIYRRCCQLRETPILKRISEQLQEAARGPIETPGVVTCLNLTGSRLTLADMNTLGDWLAVVPIKKLLLEDSELTDEGLRVILAGLLAAKPPDYHGRSSVSMKTDSTRSFQESTGVVEKLSLKNNPKITREGWKHISLFIYMCRSLKALDVSHIPFPQPRAPPKTHPSEQKKQIKVPVDDIAEILNKSVSERLGGAHLEELLMTDCALNSQNIRKIIDGVIVSGIQRLGLSNNSIDAEGIEHVVRYLRSGVCHGLDLGGNDLRNRMEQLCEGLHDRCPLWALSLADCNLGPDSVRLLLPKLVPLQNFRFVDLSHNRDLFATEPSALATLRKYLPQLHFLRRIHLEDVSMTPAQAIGLAEVLPECPRLAHLTILENPELSTLASASDEASQEEACALYASLMVAVRVSDSIICVDIDVPSQDSSEVVKALAKQVVAYCLSNMERATAQEAAVLAESAPGAPGAASSGAENVEIPEVLLHLVGHGEDSDGTDDDSAAPDEDYIVGGTGLVKALNYCLLEKASDNLRRKSMAGSRPGSGAATPRSSSRLGNREQRSAKAKSMSKDLLHSARKIRARLQPALAREARAGDETAYKRLLFLDNTLQGIIQRFEDEYPDCRVHHHRPPTASEISAALANSIGSLSSDHDPPSSNDNNNGSNKTDTADTSSAPSKGPYAAHNTGFTAAGDSGSDDEAEHDHDHDHDLPPLGLRSRHNSDVSLASRAQTLEEGRIHRLGQSVRRELLRPQLEDRLHGTTGEDAETAREPAHLRMLRDQLSQLSGGELRDMVVRDGWEETVKKIGANAEELRALARERPDEFEQWRDAQIAAQVNAGMDVPPEMRRSSKAQADDGGRGGGDGEEEESAIVDD
ncbi:cell wall biogenesis protein mhp1 [Diplodia corticola]|uniref:Cell wall biogenesis protein mhp1 n=1 Tax=Diplodia corticola TaxID=236234 RepID=A0A1J9QWB3_9PEZI|nr:cell wall biogenesis protein mhp1 [Diplodia corticola]OJD33270.1 cell wall biogenesis protein mhp1 [Diplodia corticola]